MFEGRIVDMKIKCPVCGNENYFSGIEEGTKFCSSCNRPLPEPKIPDNTENPYIKIEKGGINSAFLGSKKLLDKETFCNKVIVWLKSGLEVGEEEFYHIFSKEIEKFETDNVVESHFYLENIYFHMFLIYFNCAYVFNNKDKVDDYFDYFVDKTYDLIFKKEFGKYKKEVWKINIMRRLKDYAAVCSSEPEKKYNSAKFSILLAAEFCKNFPDKAELDSTNKIAIIDSYLYMVLSLSLKTLGNYFKKYKI